MFLKGLQNYFGFTKKEHNGILVLLILLLILLVLPLFIKKDAKKVSAAELEAKWTAFSAALVDDKVYSFRDFRATKSSSAPVYTLFDPNGLSESRWKALGLSEKQIAVIKRFEAKGGHFYKKEDVQKMYVISPETYAKLAPYIQISPPQVEAKHTPAKISKVRIELNTADSLSLEQVSGIGPAFASRILKYRERLGGFYALEQLKEVYGVDSAHFSQWLPQLALNTAAIKKIDINTASFEELKRHPYLSYKQLNALIQYRKQHGAYASLLDLKNIPLFTDEILRKLAPYLICK